MVRQVRRAADLAYGRRCAGGRMRWHPVSLAGASRWNQSGGLPQLRQASLATARLRSGRRAEEDRNAEADGLRHNLCSDIDGFSLQAAKRRSSCAATWPAKRERPLRGDHSGTANVRSGSRAAPRSWIRVALNLPLKADLHTADGHPHIVRAIGSRSRPAASLTVDFIAAGEEAPVRSQEHTAEHNATTSSPA